MSTWILLERTMHLLPDLYRQSVLPDLALLFDSTGLAAYGQQSPLLVRNDGTDLVCAIQRAPTQWPGLVIHSDHPQATVLDHLRKILFITFEQGRRGVLRYSNPTTASYFFPACSPDELRFWLGPVKLLAWYGGTWREKAAGQLRWHEIENPAANDWMKVAADHQAALNSEQQQALELQQKEQFLYQWWLKQSHIDYAQGWEWLNEGLSLEFAQTTSLERYLNLRSLHPSCPVPTSLPQGTDAVRLDHLQSHLQHPHTGQES